MVEKSQGEVDQVVADPKSSSVSDIEAKKASLRARLEKLRAEEAEISKMLRDNELEADDEDEDDEDYDEDDIHDEDDEDDSDWDDENDEEEDEEKFIADISDMTPGEQEAKEEFDQIV